jgi:hypothetical protein
MYLFIYVYLFMYVFIYFILFYFIYILIDFLTFCKVNFTSEFNSTDAFAGGTVDSVSMYIDKCTIFQYLTLL